MRHVIVRAFKPPVTVYHMNRGLKRDIFIYSHLPQTKKHEKMHTSDARSI